MSLTQGLADLIVFLIWVLLASGILVWSPDLTAGAAVSTEHRFLG
jgi:hypothetical protein